MQKVRARMKRGRAVWRGEWRSTGAGGSGGDEAMHTNRQACARRRDDGVGREEGPKGHQCQGTGHPPPGGTLQAVQPPGQALMTTLSGTSSCLHLPRPPSPLWQPLPSCSSSSMGACRIRMASTDHLQFADSLFQCQPPLTPPPPVSQPTVRITRKFVYPPCRRRRQATWCERGREIKRMDKGRR